jgi:hypothetical protein
MTNNQHAATHYLSPEEFGLLLRSEPLDNMVQRYLFEGIPYVFRDRPQEADNLIGQLCTALPLQRHNVCIVGSARTGFSLSPDGYPRRFTADSDIDVLVVDEELFDMAWLALLRWNYAHGTRYLPSAQHQRSRAREDLYWGWFRPDRMRYQGISFPQVLQPVRDFSVTWFDAFQGLSRNTTFAGRTVSGRLYRSWRHAELYHTAGLEKLRNVLPALQAGSNHGLR